MQRGIAQVGHDKPLAGIGAAIGRFAAAKGYTLIRNLASHGVGRSLHEYPEEIPTWATRGDRRRITKGMVLTVEPGIYVSADDTDAPEELRGVGVRIEDDVLVTPGGHENLTASIPKLAGEVEALVNAR